MIQDDVIRTFTMDVKWTGLRMPPCQILLRAPLAQFKLFSTTICKLLSFKPQMYIHYLAIAEVPYPREGTNHWAEAVSTRMIPAHSGLSISLQHLALLTALAPREDQKARIGQPRHELKKHLQKICSRSLYMRLHRDWILFTIVGSGKFPASPSKITGTDPHKWDPHKASSLTYNAVWTEQTVAQHWHVHMQSSL